MEWCMEGYMEWCMEGYMEGNTGDGGEDTPPFFAGRPTSDPRGIP